jgi:hypothetical protein
MALTNLTAASGVALVRLMHTTDASMQTSVVRQTVRQPQAAKQSYGGC